MGKNANFIAPLVLICLVTNSFKTPAQVSHLDEARKEIAAFRISTALAHLDTVLMSEPQSVQANYMKAEILLFNGSQGYKKYMSCLEQLNSNEECIVLSIKEAILIGNSEACQMLNQGLSAYPANGELRYAEWLLDLDKNGIGERAGEAGMLSEGIIIKPLPWIALYGYTRVEYILRNGWIYIPCKINGKEVLMMVETGSRDVNLNMISAPLVGVEPYQGSIIWRGADYPVTMVDFILEVGEIIYEVKSGLVSDFVLGNKYTGLASAGDIGPDFFRNFILTIDPFSKRLIIELPER